LTKAEQRSEAHAFLYKRTDEKLHKLEVMAMEIAKSKTVQARDQLEDMRFLRTLYEDELSLFWFGPSHLLVKDAGTGRSGSSDSSGRTGVEHHMPCRKGLVWP
jgi:hypothetical protein